LAYAIVRVNSFVNAGGSQTIRIADYSQNGLKLDKVILVRKTPYDKTTAAQNLFAAGRGVFSTQNGDDSFEIKWVGKPAGFTAFRDPGRVSLVSVGNNTVYAYFRQFFKETETKNDYYQIYMAISTDGGKTFNVQPNPLITAVPGDKTLSSGASPELTRAYDAQVTRKVDGTFYMVFEGTGLKCNYAAVSATSGDGINNWIVNHVPVACATPEINDDGSVSTPNYFQNVKGSTEYLQWASQHTISTGRNDENGNPIPDTTKSETQHYQEVLINGKIADSMISSLFEMNRYLIPRGAVGSWDSKLVASARVKYEDGYYYMVYDGANQFNCGGQWALGVMRSANPDDPLQWQRSKTGPFILGVAGSCFISYPEVVTIGEKTYVYYQNPYKNRLYDNNAVDLGADPLRTTFRHEINTSSQ
jgi:hypothetical protein